MKLFILIAITLVGSILALSDEEINQEWKQYQEKFSKIYKSPLENRRRFMIFKDNLGKIEAHNLMYEQGLVTYRNGINQFTDWTSEEFTEYLNKNQMPKSENKGKIFKSDPNFQKPESVDWREKGAVYNVKDQGMCGSCWAFSATGSLEGQNFLINGELVSLSEQNLVDCSNKFGNMGCGGGLMTYAFDYVKENGLMSEEDYPYRGYSGRCVFNASKSVINIDDYVNLESENEEQLQEVIATKGPVSVAIHATSNLQFYNRGILNDRSCSSNDSRLNHGVLAVGYGVENGVEYYLVKNSWGKSWGEKGYFQLIKKNNKCGIANMATLPVVTKK